jgi:hypothetical protein
MMYMAKLAVCSEIHTKQIHCGQKVEFLLSFQSTGSQHVRLLLLSSIFGMLKPPVRIPYSKCRALTF